jgi:hypothetical protein
VGSADDAIPGLRPAFAETLAREWRGEGRSYFLTRFLILRLLGVVYFCAFLVLVRQLAPLFGARGLTPAPLFIERASAYFGGTLPAFVRYPSVFFLNCSDGFMLALAWVGLALSLLVAAGFANSIVMALLWALYLSFVHVGQGWYSFGWEIQLCETGFLAIFLCPLLDGRPLSARSPPTAIIWLYRWLIVRIMLGAGLIKLRGDPCWVELTCLDHHYETQPLPNPLSRWLHFQPHALHALGVLFTHVVELVLPWLSFGPARARHVAGAGMLALQLALIASGNLSFLNWLTIVPILACFDDSLLARLLPRRLVNLADGARANAIGPGKLARRTVAAVFGAVLVLSVFPVANLLSSRQAMNRSYNPLAIANTYGAFGSVSEDRKELVIEGTRDATIGPDTRWLAYELPCKPGDPARRPCFVSPYHHRLDWQIWFAAMDEPDAHPWMAHLVFQLLDSDPDVARLFEHNPFGEQPPRWVRVELYRYELAPPGDASWWRREKLGTWLRPLSRDDPDLLRFLAARGFIDRSLASDD